jgi:hypothetical protein
LGARQERQDAHGTVGVWIILYVGSDGLELNQMDKGEIVLPWKYFFIRATGLRPALLLGRPGLEGPA